MTTHLRSVPPSPRFHPVCPSAPGQRGLESRRRVTCGPKSRATSGDLLVGRESPLPSQDGYVRRPRMVQWEQLTELGSTGGRRALPGMPWSRLSPRWILRLADRRALAMKQPLENSSPRKHEIFLWGCSRPTRVRQAATILTEGATACWSAESRASLRPRDHVCLCQSPC